MWVAERQLFHAQVQQSVDASGRQRRAVERGGDGPTLGGGDRIRTRVRHGIQQWGGPGAVYTCNVRMVVGLRPIGQWFVLRSTIC